MSAIEDGATTLASYSYLGAGAVLRVDYEQPDVRLDLWGGTPGSYASLDRFGRVVDHLWHNYGSSSDLVRIKHGYDRNSNRLYRRDEVARADSAAFDELYAYDGLNRLIEMQRGLLDSSNSSISSRSFEQDWSLDEVGNWKAFDEDEDGDGTLDLEQTRSHDKVNEITGITNTTGAAWGSVAHDDAGNMTKMPKPLKPTESFTATYDAWNRMVKLTDDADNDNTVAEYELDGLARRVVEKTFTAGSLDETRHVYYSAAWRRLEERVDGTAASDLHLHYVWGRRHVDELVCRDRDTTDDGNLDERLYALQDANFRVVAITSDAGPVQERYAYSPYGQRSVLNADWSEHTSPHGGSHEFRIGHQGLRHDDANLVYNRARMLHVTLGIFVQRDPTDYVDGMSLYGYLSGRVWTISDPGGLQSSPPCHAILVNCAAAPEHPCCGSGGGGDDGDGNGANGDAPPALPPGTPINIHATGAEDICGWATPLAIRNCNASIVFTNLAKIFDGCAAIKTLYALAVGDICTYLDEEFVQPLEPGRGVWVFGCEDNKDCCYKRRLHGEYPVTVHVDRTFYNFLGDPDCRVRARITGRVEIMGELGICR